MKNRMNSKAVASSTKGYCQEIGFLQYRHFPFKNKKLNKGIKSLENNWCLHRGHIDLPLVTFLATDKRQIMLFKNDPIIRPKQNIAILIIRKRISILNTNSPHF